MMIAAIFERREIFGSPFFFADFIEFAASGIPGTLKTGAGLEPSKLAESLMEKGFKGAGLTEFSKTGIPDIALAGILEYYAIDAAAIAILEHVRYSCFNGKGSRSKL